jgi:hypothetical protein
MEESMKSHFLFIVAFTALAASAAHASAMTTFDDPDQNGAPGSTVQFFGTIINVGSDTIFLNGDELNLAAPTTDFTITDLFFANAPLSLNAGDSSGLIELFDVTVNNPFPDLPTSYTGSWTITGGADGNAQDILDQESFSVTVTPEPQTTAEPQTSLLLLTGFAVIAAVGFLRLRTPSA